MLRAIILGIAGAVPGLFAPYVSASLCAYKYRQKEKTFEPDIRFSSLLSRALCAILGAAGGAILALGDGGLTAVILGLFIWLVSMVIALTDMQIHLIPNEALFVLAAAGGFLQLLTSGIFSFLYAALAAVIMIALFSIVAKMVGFWKVGAGDVKLAGAMGFVLGYPAVLTGVLAMAASMILFCLAGLAVKKLKMNTMLPMAPFLCFGLLVGLVWLVTL